jgi:hypothetical protein
VNLHDIFFGNVRKVEVGFGHAVQPIQMSSNTRHKNTLNINPIPLNYQFFDGTILEAVISQIPGHGYVYILNVLSWDDHTDR